MIVIKDKLAGLNDYTRACRYSEYAGAKMKKENEEWVIANVIPQHVRPPKNFPIKVKIRWYERDERRDVDNITFAVKFILDAFVRLSILPDDSRKYVSKIEHEVLIDKNNPRIEVEFETISELQK